MLIQERRPETTMAVERYILTFKQIRRLGPYRARRLAENVELNFYRRGETVCAAAQNPPFVLIPCGSISSGVLGLKPARPTRQAVCTIRDQHYLRVNLDTFSEIQEDYYRLNSPVIDFFLEKIFGFLSRTQIQLLRETIKIKHFEPNEVVMKAVKPLKYVLVLLDGELSISAVVKDEKVNTWPYKINRNQILKAKTFQWQKTMLKTEQNAKILTLEPGQFFGFATDGISADLVSNSRA